MQVTTFNDTKVYNLSAGKSLPQFLEEAQKKNQGLRYNQDFRRRLDLIQDFEFNIASTRVKVSPDGEFIAATGIYPPEVKLFEARELGMKCARGLNSEVVDFLFLSDDYKKLVFLCEDRHVEFHAQYGRHHKLRVPKAGRTICYDAETCGLFVGGSSAEVVRLDLEGGAFLAPLALQKLEEVNALAVNPALPVLSCAGNNGLVESYDLRDGSKPLRSLQVANLESNGQTEEQVTCCAYSKSGMQFAAGTSSGLIRVYDVRSSKALAERDHMNGFAIRSVSFHTRGLESSELLVASADSRAIKVWGANTGALTASVESKHTINQVEFVPGTGLFFAANDNARIGCFFVPALGLAPKWCSFLDSITEELEESTQKAVFDDYKFVTADDLEQLGAKDLIGSKFLEPYMHGYFMDQRLHQKLKAAMDPFAFEEYRKQRVRQKLDAKRTMRTRVKTKVTVNPQFHQQLQSAAEEGGTQGVSKKRKEQADKAHKLLADKRFQDLFADPDFAIEAKGASAERLEPLPSSLGGAPAGKPKKPKRK
eukprot:CAMPEP_0204528780 /NCGR_PEP_ID=MMETSP0661-20131031/9712_1 /ASSEMBLY_ACC=CAM_ASM_000606 /TAXON_ID=109239 /ORGANISM="Alexandrium margalefi, Strain AMGDE01CS-322" /LENGTH=536 /DNA_ID=CAMNT_0051534777 /DNA_START=30 /DNA_END=1640 /DNA_ORIENTATION=-